MKPASAQVMVLFICKRQTDLDNSSRDLEPVSHTTLVGAGKVQGERIHTKLGNQ